jgi:transposase, IS6 family
VDEDLHQGQGQVSLFTPRRWIPLGQPSISFFRPSATLAANRFLAKVLGGVNIRTFWVINTDRHAAYPPAIVQLKDEGVLEENYQHRPVQYLNNVLEQDHRPVKRRINATQLFAPVWGTIAHYEAVHMICKG